MEEKKIKIEFYINGFLLSHSDIFQFNEIKYLRSKNKIISLLLSNRIPDYQKKSMTSCKFIVFCIVIHLNPIKIITKLYLQFQCVNNALHYHVRYKINCWTRCTLIRLNLFFFFCHEQVISVWSVCSRLPFS